MPTLYHNSIRYKIRTLLIPSLRKLWATLRSIWYWLPVVAQDRHWDHVYMWAILHHKLKAMHKELSVSHTVWGNNEMRRLQHAVELSRRLSEGDYHRWMERHDEHFGRSQMVFGPAENGLRTCTIVRPGWEEGRKREHERRCFRKAYEADELERREDMEKLLDIIQRCSNRWLD